MHHLVYDLDGTLVISSRQIENDMLEMLEKLQKKGYKNVIVSGGSYEKIKWQLGNRIDLFGMIFSESGAVLHIDDKLIYKKRIVDMIDSFLLAKICSVFYDTCSKINISYVGDRVDVRNGLIYLTPVGMEADDNLRQQIIEYESKHNFRRDLIAKLKKLDVNDTIDIVKGGKTGISIIPKGIDKTQILDYFSDEGIIYFFGDNCQEDGNDRCLYIHPRCIGYEVVDYKHTLELLNQFI
jgi:HAD superfamily hydrolase (TIGR01484 family)